MVHMQVSWKGARVVTHRGTSVVVGVGNGSIGFSSEQSAGGNGVGNGILTVVGIHVRCGASGSHGVHSWSTR
jgi:hypothetical protein